MVLCQFFISKKKLVKVSFLSSNLCVLGWGIYICFLFMGNNIKIRTSEKKQITQRTCSGASKENDFDICN